MRRLWLRALAGLAGGVALLAVSAAPAGADLPFTWGPPAQVDTTSGLDSVSCASASLCVEGDALGYVVTSADPTGGTSAWSPGPDVDSDNGGLYGLSCTSSPSLLCAAADEFGDIVTSTNPTGASAWTTATPADPNSPVVLWGVSCPSSSLCVAVGDDMAGGVVFTSTNPTGSASGWRLSSPVPQTEMGGTLRSVSCPSASLCVAGEQSGEIVTSWTPATVDNGASVLFVSCASASLCVAVDGQGNVVTSTDPTGGASAWTPANVDATNALSGISCTSSPSLLCVAVDTSGNVVTSTNPTGGASAWTVTSVDSGNQLVAVSCPVASLCVAGDGDGNVVTPGTPPTPTPTPVTQTVTVARAGRGSGSVSSIPAGIACGSICSDSFTQGSIVTLTAHAASGSTFARWSGAGCSGTVTCQITLNASAAITATFDSTPRPVRRSPAPIERVALAKSKVSARHGFTLDVKLGAAGQIDVKVFRVVRRHGHRVLKLIGLVTEHGRNGADRFAIRLVHNRKLTPGSYSLIIDTVSGQRTSKTHQLRLTVTGSTDTPTGQVGRQRRRLGFVERETDERWGS
jgi:hypothetical protein